MNTLASSERVFHVNASQADPSLTHRWEPSEHHCLTSGKGLHFTIAFYGLFTPHAFSPILMPLLTAE